MFAIYIIFLLSIVPCFSDVSKMTIEEKAGQLLMVHFHGETASQEAKKLIQDVHVGGFIYYIWSNGLEDARQVKNLSSGLQEMAKIPLFIAVDQEGGRINRLKNGFTIFQSNEEVGQSGNACLAEDIAFKIGQELLSVGVNVNLAPVVDVNSNRNNPVIGDRSFSSSPQIVSEFGGFALKGYRRADIIACLKHFPGHGDTNIDSHADLPVVNKSVAELWQNELVPFANLAKDADMIMTAHILLPAIDPEKCATLSRSILQGILRDKLGYEGVIISDSLVMQGLLNNVDSIEEAAIQAINAGCDMIILGGKQLVGQSQLELTSVDIVKIHKAIVGAVKDGKISESTINASVERVLKLKRMIL